MPSTSAKRLNSATLPSITGLEASAPRLPRPSTAVPLETTATKLPLRRVVVGQRRVAGDVQAGLGDAGRIGQADRSRAVISGLVRRISSLPGRPSACSASASSGGDARGARIRQRSASPLRTSSISSGPSVVSRSHCWPPFALSHCRSRCGLREGRGFAAAKGRGNASAMPGEAARRMATDRHGPAADPAARLTAEGASPAMAQWFAPKAAHPDRARSSSAWATSSRCSSPMRKRRRRRSTSR